MVWDFCRYNGTTKLAPLYATKGKVIEQANAKLYNIRKSERQSNPSSEACDSLQTLYTGAVRKVVVCHKTKVKTRPGTEFQTGRKTTLKKHNHPFQDYSGTLPNLP